MGNAWYIVKKDIEEDSLFCQPLATDTRGEDIFAKVDTFFTALGLLSDDVSYCLHKRS